MVLGKLSLQTCALAAAVATAAAADISFTVPRYYHNMHSTANRTILLGGLVARPQEIKLSPDLARQQNIITSSVSAMDYGTGQTADFPVSPFDPAYNPLNLYGAACSYDARTQYIHCFGGQLTGQATTRKSPPEPKRHALSFYLYGGFDAIAGSTESTDLLRIDLTTYTLTRINASGSSPSGRTDHCIAALSDTKFIMHGGVSDTADTNFVRNVHIYDTQSNTWTDITPKNSTSSPPTPSARTGTGYTSLNGSFYSFGGFDGTDRNDLWVLTPPNWTWRLLSPQGTPLGNIPSPRYLTRLTTLGKYLIIGGGGNDTRLYFFNTETGAWVSSNDLLNDPWFKGLSASNPNGEGISKGGPEGGVNIGAIAGGVAAGVVLIVAVVGGIMFVRKRNARYLGGGKAATGGGKAATAGGPPPLEGLHIPEVIDVHNGRKLETPEYDSSNL
ncbi:kelch domain-containing protein 3 [Borealophlyctis nickersoniae]|nr:kelch domain-containing protein 3 [Borealophlyctis nickersoniae]